jgi:hypothetical protein
MCQERIYTDFIKDLRAGIFRDYSIPAAPVCLAPDHHLSGREGETMSEVCAIIWQQ